MLDQAKEEHLNLENVNSKLKISCRARLLQNIEQTKVKISLNDALVCVWFFSEILVDLGF